MLVLIVRLASLLASVQSHQSGLLQRFFVIFVKDPGIQPLFFKQSIFHFGNIHQLFFIVTPETLLLFTDPFQFKKARRNPRKRSALAKTDCVSQFVSQRYGSWAQALSPCLP